MGPRIWKFDEGGGILSRAAMLYAVMNALLLSGTCSAYVFTVQPACNTRRAVSPVMDETILEKALAGELEEEGLENPFMSEVGWATYLDQNAGGSYNMNQRPSLADDGYFTADIFSNPIDVVTTWFDSLIGYAKNPLDKAFPTISNDPTGNRAYPDGMNEINARTIKPKVKDFDPKKRITGIPGYNVFGAPGSKQDPNFLKDFFG